MSKTQEFKAYGSIRKMKGYGACGVILALAMLGMVFSSTASADEVSVNASENKTILEVPIVHEKLDKAIAEAKEAGVKVDVGVTQDKGVATTDTVADKQKEIEADYVKQEKEVKKATTDYTNAKAVQEKKENDDKKEELAKKGVKAEKPHITVYGDYDESQSGSLDYYKK